jgi:hypothetical protein
MGSKLGWRGGGSPLVDIEVVEYDQTRIRKWTYTRVSTPIFSSSDLVDDLVPSNSKKQPRVWTDADGNIWYRYPYRANVVLRKEDGRVCIPKNDLQRYGLARCQHQASFLLRLLHYRKGQPSLLIEAKRKRMRLLDALELEVPGVVWPRYFRKTKATRAREEAELDALLPPNMRVGSGGQVLT